MFVIALSMIALCLVIAGGLNDQFVVKLRQNVRISNVAFMQAAKMACILMIYVLLYIPTALVKMYDDRQIRHGNYGRGRSTDNLPHYS